MAEKDLEKQPAPSFNEHHPELRAGERFVGNLTPEDFNKSELVGKRAGGRAYLPDGRRVEGYVPVFVPVGSQEKQEEKVKQFEIVQKKQDLATAVKQAQTKTEIKGVGTG